MHGQEGDAASANETAPAARKARALFLTFIVILIELTSESDYLWNQVIFSYVTS